MYVEQLPSAGVYGTSSHSLGAFVLERREDGTVRNGVCIKRHGELLKLPAAILIGAAPDGPSLERFCVEEKQASLPLGAAQVCKNCRVNVCTWNGVFHAARPFTVTLLAESGKVADFVEFVRIYRNGDLMSAWNRVSDQPDPKRIAMGGDSLRANWAAATHPPHLSAMDIRVIPRTSSVLEGVDTKTRNDSQRFAEMLKDAFGAAANVALPSASPARKSFDCLEQQLKAASGVIMRRVNGQTPLEPLPEGCAPLIDAGGETPLSEAYRDTKNQATQELEQLKANAYADIARYRDELLNKVPEGKGDALIAILKDQLTPAQVATVDACALEIERSGSEAACFRALQQLPGFPKQNLENFLAAARAIDRDLTTVLEAADEARLLANELSTTVKNLTRDTNQQAQVFNAFAQSIMDNGDPFEARRNNPPLLAGEQMIPMQYSDKFQGFLLAPWNGVPLQVNNQMDAELNAATALPIVDAFGFRYQWAKTRFADFRLAAGIGYVQSTLPSGKEQAAAMPNASIGLANLKVGFGFVTGGGFPGFEDRLRLVVGADLYKLITGSNVEAL
jgi:hypothetical protein